MKALKLLAVAATAFALFTHAAPAPAAETLNLYTGNAAVNTAVKELQAIAAEIEKRTAGRVHVRVHLAGSLQIQVPDINQAVADNIVQIGDDQQFASAVPVAGILRLPALIRSREEFDIASRIVLPYVQQQYASRDLVVLGTYYYPPLIVFSSKKKVATLADLKGMKIRTLSPESSEWVKRLGGSPVTLSFNELAPALDRGTIDAVLTAASGAGWALRDQVKVNYRIPVAYSQVYEIINRRTLEKLSPEDRKTVQDVFATSLGGLTARIFEDDISLTQKMKDGGMQVFDPVAADSARSLSAMASFWDEWAKARGPVVVEALGKVRAALKR